MNLHTICLGFEAPLAVGTEYGAPAGQHSGDVIFTTNGIPVSVYDFNFAGGGGTFGLAKVDVAPFGSGQSMRTNNINLEFDVGNIGFVPAAAKFEFLDLGGVENISVNGSPIFAGDISAVPGSLGGATVSVSATPVTGGKKGLVSLAGPIQKLRIGGQEFWIDNVCAME